MFVLLELSSLLSSLFRWGSVITIGTYFCCLLNFKFSMINTKSAKSKDSCSRHKLMRINCCKEKLERPPSTEASLHCLTLLFDTGRCYSETFWCVRSTLRSHMPCAHEVSIKNFVRLKTLLKKLTVDHKMKKLDVLSYEDTRCTLSEFLADSYNEDLQ